MNSENPQNYVEMVARNAKKPDLILAEITESKFDLAHAAWGIAGEAGELLDAIKKHVIYNRPLDINNVFEELGDIEFYLEQMRQRLCVTREHILTCNMDKLRKRYPEGFTNEAANVRADKREDGSTDYVKELGV